MLALIIYFTHSILSKNMKTMQCPCCGASANNHLNCEFCGSLFVRYANLGIPTESIISSDGTIQDFVFLGLEQQLRKNISLQEFDYQFICTDVIKNGEILVQIIASSAAFDSFEIDKQGSFPGLTVHLPFPESQQNEYRNFIAMAEHKLFTYEYDLFHTFYIDFGNDPIGTAYLVSKILISVFGISSDTILSYNTCDLYPEQKAEIAKIEAKKAAASKKGKCFIATATMGNFDHPLVVDLRTFRDEWLLKQSWGNSFVECYYKYGPNVAKRIEERKLARVFCYIAIIKPLHMISVLLMKRVKSWH